MISSLHRLKGPNSMPRFIFPALLPFFAFLTACGGGGSSSGPSPAPDGAPAGVIRYEVNYQPSGTLPGHTAAARYLTVRPLIGERSFGTRAISQVQLVFAQEESRALTSPTYVDAQGRPSYVFEIASSYTAKWGGGLQCTGEPARVTVTDAAGFSFSRNVHVCVAYEQTFAAASDYGDRIATFTATGPDDLMHCGLLRTEPAAYAETTGSCKDGGQDTSLRVAEGDKLVSFVQLLPESAAGTAATARLFVEGGALAQSVAVQDDRGHTSAENARLQCCSPTPDPSAPLQTVSFVLSAELPVLVPRDVTVPVDLQYRIVDGTTGQARVDFNERAAFRGRVVKTFQARKGDRMFVQASSPTANSYLSVQIIFGVDDWGSEFGWAGTSAASVPAILNVFVAAAK